MAQSLPSLDRLFPFLAELAQNNDRAWFATHRERYEAEVRRPCLELIAALEKPLHRVSPHLVADASPNGGSLTRIQRDIRFSPDKTPYKTYAAMRFFHEDDGIRADTPSYYLRLVPGGSYLSAGVRDPPSASRTRIRAAILADPKGWMRVLAARPLWDAPPGMRMPAGLPANHSFAEDLRRPNYAARVPLMDEEVAGRAFVQRIANCFRALAPLNEFLATAVGVRW